MSDDLTQLSTEQLLMKFRRLPSLRIGIVQPQMQELERFLAEARRRDEMMAAATQWEPLENGKHDRIAGRTSIEIRADMAILENRESILTAVFPDDLRLCRRKQQPTAEGREV